jgi:hypothetical protein
MESTRVTQASGAAGVLAAVLILGGLYLIAAWGVPGMDADAAAWSAYAEREELALEIGVYLLLIPGLLLFLCTFAALAGLLPADAISTRLAGYGALGFFFFAAAGGVLSTTAASTFGFYRAFEDPTAVTVFTGVTAGYHLLHYVGVWSMALMMLASAAGLRSSAAITTRLYGAGIVLAALAFVTSFFGFGVIFGLIWLLAVSIGLLRSTPSHTGGIDLVAEARS